MKSLLAALLLLLSANNYAAVVYSQDPIANSYNQSAFINLATDPGFNGNFDGDQQLWASFRVSSVINFNQITWYGNQSDGDFAIDFHTSNCPSCYLNSVNTNNSYQTNAPNVEVLPISGPYTQAQIHQTQLNGSLYSYTLDLPSMVTLSSANLYLISFVNNYNSLPFGWASSATGNSQSVSYVVGRLQSFLVYPHNLAFTLSDTTVAAVPVPGAFWLFGSVLAGFSLLRSRKKP